MILANITNPSALEISSFIGALFFLVAGYNQVMKAVDRARDRKEPREISPQPLVVQEHMEFVRKDDWQRDRAELVLKIDDVKSQMAEQTRVSAITRKSLYDKIDAVRKEVTDKIESMPAQVVTQLLNTKNLWRSDI